MNQKSLAEVDNIIQQNFEVIATCYKCNEGFLNVNSGKLLQHIEHCSQTGQKSGRSEEENQINENHNKGDFSVQKELSMLKSQLKNITMILQNQEKGRISNTELRQKKQQTIHSSAQYPEQPQKVEVNENQEENKRFSVKEQAFKELFESHLPASYNASNLQKLKRSCLSYLKGEQMSKTSKKVFKSAKKVLEEKGVWEVFMKLRVCACSYKEELKELNEMTRNLSRHQQMMSIYNRLLSQELTLNSIRSFFENNQTKICRYSLKRLIGYLKMGQRYKKFKMKLLSLDSLLAETSKTEVTEGLIEHQIWKNEILLDAYQYMKEKDFKTALQFLTLHELGTRVSELERISPIMITKKNMIFESIKNSSKMKVKRIDIPAILSEQATLYIEKYPEQAERMFFEPGKQGEYNRFLRCLKKLLASAETPEVKELGTQLRLYDLRYTKASILYHTEDWSNIKLRDYFSNRQVQTTQSDN